MHCIIFADIPLNDGNDGVSDDGQSQVIQHFTFLNLCIVSVCITVRILDFVIGSFI